MTKQKVYYWKIRGIVLAAILGCLFFGYWLWYSIGTEGGHSPYPIAWFIIIFAILGSVVNESSQKVEFPNPTIGRIVAYFFWKATVAIVFAFVFYLMVIGGLIGGDMFPKFVAVDPKAGAHWDMLAFLTGVDPKDYKDIAKLLVWSFIAGYAEKFVPNIIGRTIKASEGAGNNG